MPGVGKTQLAGAVARLEIESGSNIVAWINSESPEKLASGLSEVAERLGVADPHGNPEISAARLRDYFSSMTDSALIVLDNAKNPDAIRPFLPSTGSVRIIITSTDRSFHSLGREIHLGPLDRKDSKQYLCSSTGLDDSDGAGLVAEDLGDLPLALSAAASTIVNRHLNFETYRSFFLNYKLPDTLSRTPGHDYPISLRRALTLSVEALENSIGYRPGNSVLSIIAMLSPTGIKHSYLPDIDGNLGAILTKCAASSLISWSRLGDSIIMHRLVARTLRERTTSPGDRSHLIEHSLKVIEPHLFSTDDAWKNRHEVAYNADQIEAIWNTKLIDRSINDEILQRAFAARLWAVAKLTEIAQTEQSIAAGRINLETSQNLLGVNHRISRVARNNLASALERAGKPAEAIPLHTKNVISWTNWASLDDIETLISRNNLANAYRLTGQLRLSIWLHEKNLDYARKYANTHPNHIVIFQSSLATAYEDSGQLERAILFYRSTLDFINQMPVPTDSYTLAIKSNLAGSLWLNNRHQDAISMYEEILGTSEADLEHDHPIRLLIRNNLARVHASLGNYGKAIEDLNKIKTCCEESLDPAHPLAGMVINSIGIVYIQSGDLEKAIEVLTNNLLFRERVFGLDHLDTIASRANLAWALEIYGNVQRAVNLHETNLYHAMQSLTYDHPTSMSIRHNLASAYTKAGQAGIAIPQLARVLSDRTRTLGPRHADTLCSLNNLGNAYMFAGYADIAIRFLVRAQAEYKRSLGEQHPDTLTANQNVAIAYTFAKHYDRAIPIFEENLSLRESTQGLDHLDTLTSRNHLAEAYLLVNQSIDAFVLYKENLDICRRRFGNSHRWTSAAASNLSHALAARQ